MDWRSLLLTAVLIQGCADIPSRPGGVDEIPGPPQSPLELVRPNHSGSAQVAPVASYLAEPLVARVMQGGVPVAGVRVQWVSTNFAARVEPSSDVTDANGYVSAQYFTGTVAGPQTAIATLNGQWLGFRTTVVPGPPAALRRISAATDSTPPLQALFIRARLEDRFGNGIPGHWLEWTVDDPDYNWLANEPATDSLGSTYTVIVFDRSPDSLLVTASLPPLPAVLPLTFRATSY